MMDYDLTRGYQKYDSAVKNLEGILDKVKVIFDITNYQSLLNEIKIKVENDEDLSKKMPYAGMQSDLEAFVFDDYVKKIEEITKKIEEELKQINPLEVTPIEALNILYKLKQELEDKNK